VKNFFQISTILLDKIQIESKISKWAYLAYYSLYSISSLSLLAEQRSVTQKSPEQLEKPVGLRQKSTDSVDKSAQTRRRADLQGGGGILSENRWLFGKMQ
jgi:hypothetical protein